MGEVENLCLETKILKTGYQRERASNSFYYVQVQGTLDCGQIL